MTEQWQELKETIIEMRDNDGTGTQKEVCKFLANLMEVLEKQMTNGWIPCSERLPEEDGEYLVTTKWKGSYSGDVYIETNIDVYWEKLKEWDNNDIIAWMPLPEPYVPDINIGKMIESEEV
ncbi:MAG: DUF551 domain-containing protein [Bacilli bacterium]|nr:DUF551 domain-containing protein [Bacilli bacterium]